MGDKKQSFVVETFTQGNRLQKFINWMGLIILTITMCHISANHRADAFVNPESNLVTGLYLIPVLLLAGLYGYLVAYIVFLISFICALMFNMTGAYTMIIYMVMIFCFAIIGEWYMFENLLKTFILCCITILVITVNGYFCYSAITDMDYGPVNFFTGQFFTYKELFAVFVSGFILYLLFNYAPDSVKLCFPLGVVYTEKFKNDEEAKRRLKNTKVSLKITLSIIGVMLIFSVFISVFMMALFPDMKRIFVSRNETNTELSEESRGFITSDLDQMDYQIDGAMISLDVKMVLLMFCVGVPFTAIANFFTKSFIAGPIGEMSDFMEQYVFTSDEDKILFGHKIDDIYVNTHDEMQVMYEALRATVYEIEAYIERMKEEQKLQADLEIAKQASEAKSSFLSNMSHEIRTPINAVLGMNEMILRESTEGQIKEYATNVKSAGNSLLTIVNDILDFSKIEAGKMEIIVAQYQLGSTVNDLINMILSKVEEKNLELEVNVDEHTPSLLIGDEVRIKQILTNLLSNAVKYTEKGKITLNVSYEPINDNSIGLKFEVCDTGIGIKEEDLEKLYSPFERFDEVRNRTIEGSGLGMSIVQKLLDLMSTKLEVKSVYGEGSKFSFVVKQQVVSWEEVGDFKEKYREFIQTSEAYHERFQAPTAKILVVDDTEINLTVIKSLLKMTLVQVDTAVSGRETLKKVKETKYDVIFLDHRMPEMDGIETFEAMKNLDGNLNIDVPIIALTANAVSGAKEEYVKHGFNDYLAKPVNALELEKMLEYYIPSEKIQAVSIKHGEDEFVPNLCTIPEDSILHELSDINLKEAIQNCGGCDVLENVIKDFYISIDSKAAAIKGFLEEEDIRNYTVLVHALKSSSRLIGAMELSEMCAELEEYGDKDNIEAIREKNDEMLQKYLSYKESLKAVDKKDKSDLPEISIDELEGAFKDIKELIEAYDFDTADSILKMLDDYSIPKEAAEKYKNLVELMSAVDRDGILKLL